MDERDKILGVGDATTMQDERPNFSLAVLGFAHEEDLLEHEGAPLDTDEPRIESERGSEGELFTKRNVHVHDDGGVSLAKTEGKGAALHHDIPSTQIQVERIAGISQVSVEVTIKETDAIVELADGCAG